MNKADASDKMGENGERIENSELDEKEVRRITLISDVHLEFRRRYEDIENGDILVLAGDIGTFDCDYDAFIRMCSEKFNYVILVAGNHEFYNSRGCAHVLNRLKEIVDSYPNVWYLNRDSVDIAGLRFLGCTMWTHIPDKYAFVVQEMMTDYLRIRVKENMRKRKITPDDVNSWHFIDKLWLKKEIDDSPLPVVVVTHHSPMFETFPKAIDYAFHSDLTSLMTSKCILWCHGHTHHYRRETCFDTTIWCNPLGYPIEETGFVPNDTFQIKVSNS